MEPLKLGILGCSGRMGRMLMAGALADPAFRLVGGVDRADSPAIGQDLGTLAGALPLGLSAGSDLEALLAEADTVIDFTAPAATVANAAAAATAGTALVVGTTGLSAQQVDALRQAAERVAVVFAPNMSLGVTLLAALVRQAAARLGDDWDIEIVEMHHRHKVDAPSGTALGLGRAAAEGRGIDLEANAIRQRDGHTGARPRGPIGFATLRGGDVVGDHSVIFAAEGERLELTHKASSRAVFARGALRAALWTRGRGPGLYDMNDVLDL